MGENSKLAAAAVLIAAVIAFILIVTEEGPALPPPEVLCSGPVDEAGPFLLCDSKTFKKENVK